MLFSGRLSPPGDGTASEALTEEAVWTSSVAGGTESGLWIPVVVPFSGEPHVWKGLLGWL